MKKQKAIGKLLNLKKKVKNFGRGNSAKINKKGEIDINEEICKKEVEDIDTWKREVITAISYLFKESPNRQYYIDNINSVDFSVINLIEDKDKEKEKVFKIFEEMLKEIKEYW